MKGFTRSFFRNLGLVSLVAAMVAVPGASANAVQPPQPKLVSDDPAAWTPDVMDGEVDSIVQVGDRIVVGGNFTQIKEKGQNKPVLDQPYIFAFDPATGSIDNNFLPQLSSDVRVVLPSPDGTSVYVGGTFNTVNGITSRKLTRLNLSDGSITAGFKPSNIDARVLDLRLVGDQLVAAGSFPKVGSYTTSGLASFNASTGKVTEFLLPTIADPRKGTLAVTKMDVTPDGSRLVAIGNFATVDGQSRPQLAVFDTSGANATLADWRSPFYDVTKCSKSFETYMRDIDIDPTGTYFVVSTTGAYGGADSPCDVIARFEINTSGSTIAPTWRSYTGGDTTYAVAITGSVVYAGGHMRWVNNPWAGDRAGAGAVSRPGIAALDPKSGVPLSWNPGREPRGVGVFDILATDSGLYIGSDTDWVAGEQHRKLAFFPLEGGRNIPAGKVGALPNDVYLMSNPTTGGDKVTRVYYDGANAPVSADTISGDQNGLQDWNDARGTMLVDGTVYSAWSDGTLRAASYDGVDFGDPRTLDLAGNNTTSGLSQWFGTDASKVTGMFFDPSDNRMYYTMTGNSNLYWRGFAPESEIVGAARFAATGTINSLSPSRVAGMFLAGDWLYFADRTSGKLYRIGFNRGVVSGTAEMVDQSMDWRSRGGFIWNGSPALPQSDPIAVFDTTCADLHCAFDATGSSDPDGRVAQWNWDFGDGTVASGETAEHTYDADGTYTVSLTVTDNRGRTNTSSQALSVQSTPVPEVDFRAAAASSTNSSRASVSVPAEVQQGDAMLAFVSVNSDAAHTEVPTGWNAVGERNAGGMSTRLYVKVATPADSGNSIVFGHSAVTKTDVTLLTYSGTDAVDPILAWEATAETDTTASHRTPGVPLSPQTNTVVSFWADKSSATTAWTVDPDQSLRSTLIGTGSGRISSVATDQRVSAAPTGSVPGQVAVADSATRRATMWTVSLRPLG